MELVMVILLRVMNNLELEFVNEINSVLIGHAVAEETVKQAIKISGAIKRSENVETHG